MSKETIIQSTTGDMSPIINGNGNTIIFNMQMPITKPEIEAEFLKLETGDFEDITNEVDEKLHENHISIFSYIKNYWLQLKKQLVNDDFHEPWIPLVPADMGTREKKRQWKVTPIYQGIVFPLSYFFIEMDGGRYLIPLPKVEYNREENTTDKNNRIKKCSITQVQYKLGKVLSIDTYGYDTMREDCKIEVET